MNKINQDIKLMARGAGIPLWRICQYLHISEPTLTRRLRKELTETEKSKIIVIINELKEESAHEQ